MLGVVLLSSVEFKDYSVQVKSTLQDCAIAFLHEVGGELKSRAIRNSDMHRRSGKTSGSYDYTVDEGDFVAYIGSDYNNALWEEFGTGQFALKGDGRKGYWVYIDDGGASGNKSKSPKTYTLKEAKFIVARMREKGLNAYYTNGKQARRPLWKAFESMKGNIDRMARERFGDLK